MGTNKPQVYVKLIDKAPGPSYRQEQMHTCINIWFYPIMD